MDSSAAACRTVLGRLGCVTNLGQLHAHAGVRASARRDGDGDKRTEALEKQADNVPPLVEDT